MRCVLEWLGRLLCWGEVPKGSHDFGRWAEERAVRWYQRRGFVVVERNYKAGGGEVDVVVRKDGLWAFVEVKARRSDAYGLPCEAVSLEKQQRIIKATRHFLARQELWEVEVRFDVFGVIVSGEEQQINWIEGAFEDQK